MLAACELRSACSCLGTCPATLAVHLRQAEQGRLPAPHDAADAAALVQYARKLQAAQASEASVNQELLDKLAYTAAGELSPMAAIIGGCVGQEARPRPQGHGCFAPYSIISQRPGNGIPLPERSRTVTATCAVSFLYSPECC